MLLGCQRPVDPRRSDFQKIGFVPGIEIVEKRRRRARQLGGRIEVERSVTVGGHRDPAGPGIYRDGIDLISGAGELNREQLGHLLWRR